MARALGEEGEEVRFGVKEGLGEEVRLVGGTEVGESLGEGRGLVGRAGGMAGIEEGSAGRGEIGVW